MNEEGILKFATQQSVLLFSGRLDSAVSRFDLPIPVYGPVEARLLTSREELRHCMERCLRTLKEKSVDFLTPSSVRIENSSQRRCLVRVDWDHINMAGESLCTSTSRFILRFDPGESEPNIEFVEHDGGCNCIPANDLTKDDPLQSKAKLV